MRGFAGLLAGSLSCLLIGCSTGTVPTLTGTAKVTATGVHGVVHGGQQPVTGATITLWSAGTSGYGSTGTSLATTTTDSTGSFNITGSYTCPGTDPYVYITSTGGNPGFSSGTNNTAISLMAALTDCNTLHTNAASTFINIDEVTTVAAAYALQRFMNTSTGAIGSYSWANTGMQNAFLTASNLASTSLGTAYSVTPYGNGVVPQQEINTLADILATCVNTSSSSSTGCANLFFNISPTPSNTLQAALDIALRPGLNVTPLYNLVTGTPPFQPTLSSAPNDWTVAMSFNDGSSNPSALAIDSSGNVWTADYAAGNTFSRLTKLNTLGVPQSGSPFSANLSGAVALAIDTSGDVWVANNGTNSLEEYGNSGNTLAGPITGFTAPNAMAFDPNGDLWVVNSTGSQVTELNPNSQSTIATYSTDISSPFTIASDSQGNMWVGNSGSVTELNVLGVPQGGSPYTSGGITSPNDIAIDGSNDVWIANSFGDVSELSSSGTALSGSSGDSGGGVGDALGIAIDGIGNVWTADGSNNRLSELTSNGSAVSLSTGYRGGNLNDPAALAIDESGNVWVANINSTTTGSVTTTISEFVGAATPVYTPLSVATEDAQLGVKPGTPIPVSVLSGVVPYYTPGAAYSAQLYASGGNSGSYTWSSPSTFPTGLSISSGGLISGATSVTGSTTVSVQACDAQNSSNCSPAHALTLTANTTLTALGNESALSSSYAVEFESYRNGSSAGQVYGSDALASITFNGSGTITGEIDSNNPNKTGVLTPRTITGYYTYGSDNRGTLVIIPSGGTGDEFAFVGENFSGSTPQTLRLIELDDTQASGDGSFSTGTGIGKMQTSGAFVQATLNQSFAFGMQGETPCTNDSGVNPSCATISPFGPLSVVGQFTGSSPNTITGEEDAAGVNTTWNAVSLTGNYTTPDSFGRGTVTFGAGSSTYPAAGVNFVYYIVNSGEMFLITQDGHGTRSLLTGDALVQSGSLSNSTLTGNYVAYEMSPAGGDGVATPPTSLDSSLIYLSVQSGSQIAVTLDEHNGSQGTLKLEKSQGPFTYSVASNGRMTISGGGGSPLFYVVSSGAAFGTEQPSSTNQGGPGLITGVQQTAGTFTCGPSSGTFAVGEPPQPIADDTLDGYFVAGSGTFTLDYASPKGYLEQGLGGTSSCTTDGLTSTTGRYVLTTTITAFNSTNNNVSYTIVPNSKYVQMDINPADGKPQVITIDK